MNGIIYKRSPLPEGSLLLKVILESGELQNFKIPGILKSNKRNSFFMAPATIWEFITSGVVRDTIIPKEYSLVHSAVDFNTPYNELMLVAEIMKPLNQLKPGLSNPDIYEQTKKVILNWCSNDKDLQNNLLNHYYIMFLDHMGLFHYNEQCLHCRKDLNEHDKYHLFSGSVCTACLSNQIFRDEEVLPNSWIIKQINATYVDTVNETQKKYNDIEYRIRIIKYLQYSM